jgi:hypothetical protein
LLPSHVGRGDAFQVRARDLGMVETPYYKGAEHVTRGDISAPSGVPTGAMLGSKANIFQRRSVAPSRRGQ